MNEHARWIWLDPEKYAQYSKSPISRFDPFYEECPFVVAEFKKRVEVPQKAEKMVVNISADVKFWLYVNGTYVGQGPVLPGGDYGIDRPMPYQYYNTYTVELQEDHVEFFVMVQNVPTAFCDMSQGKNGLILSAEIFCEDGTKQEVWTDESWSARVNRQRLACNQTDFTIPEEDWTYAVPTETIWKLRKPDILMLEEERIQPEEFEPFVVEPGETKEMTYHFDKIYSLFHQVETEGETHYTISIRDFERHENREGGISDLIIGEGEMDFRGLTMVSAGGCHVTVQNEGTSPLRVKMIAGYFTHYPTSQNGEFTCSEESLNKIYQMGKHALLICRQTIELDSPLHQENLGCVGDYYISSLMNYFTDGDTRLTRLDLVRIADCLKLYDGYMFHTTYSMIWIRMVWDYYMFSADASILPEISEALELLLEKMHSYTTRDEIIDHPPSYMFVDWLEVDGISLHHPPMALGQAVLNAFYYDGLKTAVKLYQTMGNAELAAKYEKRAEILKKSFHANFYEKERGLYFDGHNKPHDPGQWMPANPEKRYFSWHTNTLAVLFDLAPEEEQSRIMEAILGDMTLINPQPYFMHFVLEAIYKVGLFEKYGIAQLMRWKDMTEFEKGLQEGWYDVSGYGFDYSHVWGGTPTYQLPSKLSGLEMVEPGFRKIRLKPRLFGLEYAWIKIPTPYGYIEIKMEKGKKPKIRVPKEIEVES